MTSRASSPPAVHRHQTQPDRRRHPRAVHRLVAGQGAGRCREPPTSATSATGSPPPPNWPEYPSRRSSIRSASCRPCPARQRTNAARIPVLGVPRRRLQAGRPLQGAGRASVRGRNREVSYSTTWPTMWQRRRTSHRNIRKSSHGWKRISTVPVAKPPNGSRNGRTEKQATEEWMTEK